MIKTKTNVAQDLYNLIMEKCIGKRIVTEYAQSVVKKLNEKYKMPYIKAADIISLRVDLNMLSEFELFCVYDILDPNRIPHLYTDVEIKKYSSSTFESDKIYLPLKIKMIQIAEDQYIGRISARELKSWGDAGFINYNQNTQRTMQHIIRGDREYYQITLNKSAVEDISQLMDKGVYISDDVTLNIPDDDDVVFSYNKDTMELTIKKIKAFDIIDGYHRYVSIIKECNLNSEFDYPMELRITNYPESKAQQFIWQKDQKTKMKKVDSDTLNQEKLSNRVIARLNNDSTSILYHQLDRNNDMIPVGVFSIAIDKIFFSKRIKEEDKNQEVRKAAGIIKDVFERIELKKQYNQIETVCILYAAKNGIEDINSLIAKTQNSITKNNPTVDTIIKHIETLEGGDDSNV